MKENTKVSFPSKVCYGFGAAGGTMMTMLLSSFLLAYYTDTALIGAAAVSTMFLLVRFLDGVTDVIMGDLIDKTKSRLGKTRPWLLASAPLMLVGIILILHVPMQWSGAMKLVYAYLTYIFLNCIVYTMYVISYNSLLARVTLDPNDRMSTSVVANIINSVANIFAGSVTTLLSVKFGWHLTSIVLGVVAGVSILICFLGMKEQVGIDDNVDKKEKKMPTKEAFSIVLKNRYTFLLLALSMMILLTNANAIGSTIFYCNQILGDPVFMATLLSIGQIPSMIILFFMPYFSKKFSTRNFMIAGTLIMMAGFILLGLAGTNHTLILIGTIMRNVGVAPMFPGLAVLTSEVVDYGEYKSGIRSEGLTNAFQSVGAKLGMGFGGSMTGWVLAMGGYNPTVAEQPVSALNAIKFDFSWLNLILAAVLLTIIILLNVEKYRPEIEAAIGKKEGME